MGIEVSYRRLKQQEFDRVLRDPKEREAFFGSILPEADLDELLMLAQNPEAVRAKAPDILAAFQRRAEDPTRVDLEKDWHALHFLLTGDDSLKTGHVADDPLHNVVMGGHETSLTTGYGPAKSFTMEEVAAIARELGKISVDDLRTRFSADVFNAADIYATPRPGGWDDREIEGVFYIYPKLVKFFQDAAAAGEIVVVYAI